MSKRTTETWSLQGINDALQNLEHEKKKIVIPRFQRGQRWSPQQEESFIDSIQKGYPIGTLLFYKTLEQEENIVREVYTLVDGLQRSTAIHRYMESPMKYFGENDVSDAFVDDVFKFLNFPEEQKSNLTPIIKKAYVNYIHNLTSYKNPQAYTLAKSILNEVAIENKDEILDEFIICLSSHLENIVQVHNDIAKSEIPAVVYEGDENDLPEIFTRINSKGTPLNAYEIYAASWPQNNKIEIRNDKIIDHILARYDALHDDVYTIKGYNREEIRISKKVTLFEYVFGLSKWLSVKFPLIAFDKHLKEDEVSPIGFELLDAIFFETKKIGELYKVLQGLNVNHLEKALEDCISIVDNVVSPITRFKGNRRKDEIKPIYSKNQILSIIAFVFKERYSLDNLTNPKSTWNENENLLKKRIFAHFIFDIIDVAWDQGGSRLHQVVSSGKYHDDISASAWESSLTNMYEKQKLRQERNSVKQASNADIAFLNCIYLTKFTAMDQLSLEKFDIEHIATKDLMKDIIRKTTESGGLPVSSIANLCYLPEYENRAKGNKTFYQDKQYLKRVTLQDIEEKYSFTQQEDLEWVELPFDMGDFDELKNEYMAFLDKRFDIQKREFYEVMGVDPSTIRTGVIPQRVQTETRQEQTTISTTYEPIIRGLSSYFDREFVKQDRTLIVDEDNKICAVMAYSKMYPQGARRKYWFAVHPRKIEQCTSDKGYYVFACSNDNIAVAVPIDFLTEHLEYLNVTNQTEVNRKYYHMVLFVDGTKVSWMLSKPEIQEIDISHFGFHL